MNVLTKMDMVTDKHRQQELQNYINPDPQASVPFRSLLAMAFRTLYVEEHRRAPHLALVIFKLCTGSRVAVAPGLFFGATPAVFSGHKRFVDTLTHDATKQPPLVFTLRGHLPSVGIYPPWVFTLRECLPSVGIRWGL